MNVISFCERHGLTNMLNLLRHSGPTNHMQEVFALGVLEEILASDDAKMEELRSMRAAIHPVERAAALRALKLVQQQELEKKNVTIANLREKIAVLEAQLAQKNLPRDCVPETPHAQGGDEDETCCNQTQLIWADAGSPETQSENLLQEQARVLGRN